MLQGQGLSVGDAVRQVGTTQEGYYRWLRQYGGVSRDQLKRLKKLEAENQRLRRAVSELTLDKMILSEAARVVRAVAETVWGTNSGPNGRGP